MVIYKNSQIKLSPKEKLIKHLIENREPRSIMMASGSIIIDYKNTYNIVKELEPTIISKQKIGNTNLIKLNFVPNQSIYSVEEKRTKEFLLKHPSLKVVKSYIEEIGYPFLIALIFGSYVKNTKTDKSDIDLCIISDNKDKTKTLYEKLALLSIKIEIQDFSTKEFISMIEKVQNNLGHEIVKSNIIIYGIENYYNLISRWMKIE